MGLPRRRSVAAAGVAVLACLLAACQPSTAPAATPPGTPATTTPSQSPSPTPTPAELDFTGPGAAEVMINRLLADAGSRRLVMVEVTKATVTVTVLPTADAEPVAWAWRDGKEQEVASDLEYVDQAVFDIDGFDVSDVGRLFSQAAEVSGSTANQSLHIVDFSGGRVVMAVTTNPESRTVFFERDGSLLPELDFHTLSGISAGLEVVLGSRAVVQSLGIDSATGVWVDYPGAESTTVRRQRTSKVPVTTTTRDETLDLPQFAVAQVDPAVIWKVVGNAVQDGSLASGQEWSVTVEDREKRGTPRMYFTFGMATRVTDMAGHAVTNP